MIDLFLLTTTVTLLFFGFEVRPWIVRNYPESRYSVDLMVIAVTITTILIPLISLIASGTIPIASYFIALPILTGYMLYYGINHRNEVKATSRRVFVGLLGVYGYVFCASGVLMFWVAPFITKIIL